MKDLDIFADIFNERRILDGTDIHITSEHPPAYRVRGEIRFSSIIPALTTEEVNVVLQRLLPTHERIPQRHEANAIDAIYVHEGIRYRVHANLTSHSRNIAIRTLLNASDLSFDLLRLPPILKSFVTKPHGLILLLGSTGAGKTTTRAAITEYINTTFRKHVIILEDIREFEHQSRLSLISQYSIPAETDLKSYRTTMISALRENPDIVMFGDMRNPELISLALNMAATGHLVVAELHAGNVQHALYRIAGNASARQQRHIREQLAELLIGAVAQRLIKKGTNEAVPVAEILINTDATRSLIRSGKFSAIPDIMRMSRDIGMILFEDALFKLT